MKKLTSGEIRQLWLDFFKSKGHMIEPGAALVPQNDPTLLWINSGVAALKKYFDGTVVPKNHRITNAQKSIRTNDIENVGHTARHQKRTESGSLNKSIKLFFMITPKKRLTIK